MLRSSLVRDEGRLTVAAFRLSSPNAVPKVFLRFFDVHDRNFVPVYFRTVNVGHWIRCKGIGRHVFS
jgi:hypothetical protein